MNQVGKYSLQKKSVHSNIYFLNFPEYISYTGLPLLWTIGPCLCWSEQRIVFLEKEGGSNIIFPFILRLLGRISSS